MCKLKMLALVTVMCLLLVSCGELAVSVTTATTTETTIATTVATEEMRTEGVTLVTTDTTLQTTEATTATTTVVSTITTSQTVTTEKTTATTTATTAQQSVVPTYEWQSHPQDFKLIAFGFDDLPCSAVNVQLIVEAVSQYEGFATCFVLGENIEKNGTSLLEYVTQYGFEIGNHSYSHSRMTELTYQEITADLKKTNNLLKRSMGITPKWFRPPYLAKNSTVQAACFAVDGMHVMNGNKNSQNNTWYNVEDGGDVLRDAVANAYDGAVYVMHPARSQTAWAMEEICKALYEKGYRFCTMSQLFEYKGITPQYDKSYYDVNG